MEFKEVIVNPIYHKSLHERTEMRLSVDSFGRYYIRYGKAFFDTLDETWYPTREGATIPLSVETGQALMVSIAEILAFAETEGIITKVLK